MGITWQQIKVGQIDRTFHIRLFRTLLPTWQKIFFLFPHPSPSNPPIHKIKSPFAIFSSPNPSPLPMGALSLLSPLFQASHPAHTSPLAPLSLSLFTSSWALEHPLAAACALLPYIPRALPRGSCTFTLSFGVCHSCCPLSIQFYTRFSQTSSKPLLAKA